ncbi:biphenyl-2,3-diol 1,2-dioxygenase [Halobacteriales archaeon QS_1_67_19]|nr:MAG: biphenyl-2,3-diol 1,2-dioxygenase [Halobacteriales archaeon QS_1_67_19]
MDDALELGHVHLKVRDVDRSVEFYRDALGLAVTERAGRFAFLSGGEKHHEVALQELGPDASDPGRGVGLYHAAFEVATPEALAATDRRLRERGVAVTPVDHGISEALYFDDPDGNGLEVYLDTRAERDREAWRGRNEPFDPESLGE